MWKLKAFAKVEGDSKDTVFRKSLILLIALTLCVCAVIWTGMYYLIFGWGLITFLPFLYFILVGSSIVAAHYLKNYLILIYTFIICMIWITAFIQWSIGSFDQSGFVSIWSFLGVMGAVIFLSRRHAIFSMSMFILVIVISALYEPALLGHQVYVSGSVRTLFYVMNIGMATIVVFAASLWFVKTIQDEKNNSESLLLNILPYDVAEELRQNGHANPKHFDNVSVLFTDFVGFTLISEKLTPTELVKEINYCFTAFDKIIEHHGLEKIKTIGDAYLAVCGVPTEYKEHAKSTVRAAIEIIGFVKQREMNGGPFKIRVGINSGPVVAGIVGVKKYAYDIWGDTVNIAARMEQNSTDGKINISETTYDLVKNEFNCIQRGKIIAKNKGEINMYFVEEPSK